MILQIINEHRHDTSDHQETVCVDGSIGSIELTLLIVLIILCSLMTLSMLPILVGDTDAMIPVLTIWDIVLVERMLMLLIARATSFSKELLLFHFPSFALPSLSSLVTSRTYSNFSLSIFFSLLSFESSNK